MASNGVQVSTKAPSTKEKCTRSRWVTIILIVIIVDFSLTAVIVGPLGAKARENQVYCANVSAPVTKYTRSGSLALLGTVDDLECIEQKIRARINDQGSVAVYQEECNTLNTVTFPINRRSLTYNNVTDPIVVLNEDVDDNYFLNGTVDVIVNATFSSISTEIYVCLFLDLNTFNDFTNLDKNWKDYVNQSDCRVMTKGHSNTTFVIKSPNFVFIAMAPTERLTTLQFGYNGTAENYGQPTDNMNKVCSLSSDKESESQCSFSVDSNSTSLCVLASTEDNADGSIDYISITLTFIQNKEKIVMFIVMAVVISIIVLAAVILSTIILVVTNCPYATVTRFKSLNHPGYDEI